MKHGQDKKNRKCHKYRARTREGVSATPKQIDDQADNRNGDEETSKPSGILLDPFDLLVIRVEAFCEHLTDKSIASILAHEGVLYLFIQGA